MLTGSSSESTIDLVDMDSFIRDGYVAVRGAFGERTASACRDMIWDSLADQGISRADRATWTRPQPGIDVPDGFALDGTDHSPVPQAIIKGLATLDR